MLAAHGAAWCVADTDESPPDRVEPAPLTYFRLRRETYTDDDLRSWAGRVRELTAGGSEVFSFVKQGNLTPSRQLIKLRIRSRFGSYWKKHCRRRDRFRPLDFEPTAEEFRETDLSRLTERELALGWFLAENGNDKAAAARHFQVSRPTIYAWLREIRRKLA